MIAGVVLAAGGASRFGSPKQLAELDGVPLLQHAIDAVLDVPAVDPVAVVLGASAERVREAVGDADWVIVTLGDQPRVTSEVIAAVADEAGSAPAGVTAIRAMYDGVPGHPVALSRAMLPGVAKLRGDVGARELLGSASVRTFEAGRLCDPVDVDTPEELEGLRT